MRVGLTLGKYAPLHNGHRHVIDTALGEVDHLIVLAYPAPEFTDVPLAVRMGYPRALPAGRGAGRLGWSDRRRVRLRHHPKARRVHRSRPSRSQGHALLLERTLRRARQPGPRCCRSARGRGAPDRPDLGHQGPGRPVRSAASRPAAGLPRPITHVAIVGAPSTGKTTLAERLAREFATVWTPEFGRDYWHEHNVDRRLSHAQLLDLAQGHLALEEKRLQDANRYLFTDTNALTTAAFSLDYHGAVGSGARDARCGRADQVRPDDPLRRRHPVRRHARPVRSRAS